MRGTSGREVIAEIKEEAGDGKEEKGGGIMKEMKMKEGYMKKDR